MHKKISEAMLLWRFRNETEAAKKYAVEKPPGWEYPLTLELLRPRMAKLRVSFDDIQRRTPINAIWINEENFAVWYESKTTFLLKVMHKAVEITQNDLRKSWGKRGEPGDAIAIFRAVDGLTGCGRQLVKWENEVASIHVPHRIEKIRHYMREWGSFSLEPFEKLVVQLTSITSDPTASGSYKIELSWGRLPNIDKLNRAIDRLNE